MELIMLQPSISSADARLAPDVTAPTIHVAPPEGKPRR